MNRFDANWEPNGKTAKRAAEPKFIASVSRSFCLSARSTDDDETIVWTSEFSTTISPADAAANRRFEDAEVDEAKNRFEKNATRTDFATPFADFALDPANAKKPFVPLGLVGMTLPQIERAAILETLLACNGNRSRTARRLGVSEKTIYNKIKTYKLQAEIDAVFGNAC